MREGFRQCMAWLHTWSGLVVGWVLFFVFVTGTAGYFQHDITRWMQPERVASAATQATPEETRRMVRLAMDRLEQVAPAAASWRITLPHDAPALGGWQALAIRWESMPQAAHERGASGSEQLDPASGEPMPPEPQPRVTAGGRGLYRMHYVLHYMPVQWGIRLVGVCTMLMLIAIVSGVITHKKIFRDFFTFRPGKGQRSWLDAHNAISVMALPFFLMITYSGLVFLLFNYMPAGRDVLYGTGAANSRVFFDELLERSAHRHLPVVRPRADAMDRLAHAEQEWGAGQVASITLEHLEGQAPELVLSPVGGGGLDFGYPPTLRFDTDSGRLLAAESSPGGSARQTQSVIFNLHEGLFAGFWGRWLYFAAGLLGCAMIATGLVLWTVKRRKHHLGSGREDAEDFGLRLVERLNVATIAGLPLAVAAYFWANRLLPVDMGERAAWEFHSLFAAWLGALFFAWARPLARAWVELLWGCCLAYALVPVVNALTTHRHLLRSVPEGDWAFAGFDLTMLGLAALCAVLARKVQRRLAPKGLPGAPVAAAVQGAA
ncbi:PepSY-associated TM helix domain-containing protein [Comamonas terrigena]|uniref:PepSY-associated TM helix domain-containing protein n=1 Tax=Comamonas terrigena TaxID=32013 RepID=UPI002447EFD2|nr:PepSY-associated TM helix domain-containing protein [Comamonas terrigena]MDH1703151.1 PepSY domain-containing protein [Comamonas terrigena]